MSSPPSVHTSKGVPLSPEVVADLQREMGYVLPVFTRHACGVPRIYAANESQAKSLHKLTGLKALSDAQLEAMRELGFIVEFTDDPNPRAFRGGAKKSGAGEGISTGDSTGAQD